MKITAETLGNPAFQEYFSTQYAYYCGSMYKGIASKEMVVALANSGFLGFLGTGGMRLEEIESSLNYISNSLSMFEPYGANILPSYNNPELENKTIDLLLQYDVRVVEASSYVELSPALVRYAFNGLRRGTDGRVIRKNRVIAKLSRSEVARSFIEPVPESVLSSLVETKLISREEAELAATLPLASAICVESDSAGHTDSGISFAQFPAIKSLATSLTKRNASEKILVGSAGGLGSPDAIAGAFAMGADFVVTGSINQCSAEANISYEVKDILQALSVQDTTYAPSGDLFEMGAKVQVVKKGSMFALRANRLYELYTQYDSLDALTPSIIDELETQYFGKSISDIWEETSNHYQKANPEVLKSAANNPKTKMALVFKWYFVHTTRVALEGKKNGRGDYQIHCGPAMGAFNEIVKGSSLESWQKRGVAEIGKFLMEGAASVLSDLYAEQSNKAFEQTRKSATPKSTAKVAKTDVEAAISELEEIVDVQLDASDWVTVTREMINQFAETTLDEYWLHVDQERAKQESQFGDTIAHGLLALSLVSHFREQCFPEFPSNATGMVYGFDNVRFINPVPVNSRVRGVFTLKEIVKNPDNSLTTKAKFSIEIHGNPVPALIGDLLGYITFSSGE
ncbi:PfaD family polyunsaturated fatty acid/polyketide biosynthesis protein [Vibrio penaeicida]|uniref:PfaD family polyunsaturated fatty acid/polyketide biosynthesis protein n=1 Tax=Vibrio penaeicida TaxID=104609 RepID=UPI000CEA083D|nr:PfaD family polyunsaturated fatty acid/polyketide biosynthesis protein [Vibrio penaeicida]